MKPYFKAIPRQINEDWIKSVREQPERLRMFTSAELLEISELLDEFREQQKCIIQEVRQNGFEVTEYRDFPYLYHADELGANISRLLVDRMQEEQPRERPKIRAVDVAWFYYSEFFPVEFVKLDRNRRLMSDRHKVNFRTLQSRCQDVVKKDGEKKQHRERLTKKELLKRVEPDKVRVLANELPPEQDDIKEQIIDALDVHSNLK